MKPLEPDKEQSATLTPSRRSILTTTFAAGATLAASLTLPIARATGRPQETSMKPKAFVYTELQISVPFENAPWQRINDAIRQQPGFINKTWLAGVANNSVGGFYSFDSIENAQAFVTGYFPSEAAGFGVAHNTRIFDATVVDAASADIGSPYFGGALGQAPGAFVYTEVQVNVPFENAPWADRNPVLKAQQGLLSKTWLSGLHTNTLGGIDAFDTLENATKFAVEDFPKTAKKMNAAFYTRIFNAPATEAASRDLNSPFYA